MWLLEGHSQSSGGGFADTKSIEMEKYAIQPQQTLTICTRRRAYGGLRHLELK